MILNLQVLRAVAAISVVVFHGIGIGEQYGFPSSLLSPRQAWGAAGVDVFFVLSGFVMVLIQVRRRRSAQGFLANRIARIAPVYWFLTLGLALLMVAVPWVFNSTTGAPLEFLVSLLRSMGFVAGVFGESPMLYVGWTLEFEMLFYLIVAFGIALGGSLERGVAAATLVLLSMVLTGVTGPIALEFLFGMGCGLWYVRRGISRLSEPAAALAILALAAVWLGAPWVDQRGWTRLPLWGVPAALLLVCALAMPQIRKGFWTFLGGASYSIYLVQVFTLPAIFKSAILIGLPGGSTLAGNLLLMAATTATIIAGALVNVFVEQPMSRSVHRLRSLGQAHAPIRL